MYVGVDSRDAPAFWIRPIGPAVASGDEVGFASGGGSSYCHTAPGARIDDVGRSPLTFGSHRAESVSSFCSDRRRIEAGSMRRRPQTACGKAASRAAYSDSDTGKSTEWPSHAAGGHTDVIRWVVVIRSSDRTEIH